MLSGVRAWVSQRVLHSWAGAARPSLCLQLAAQWATQPPAPLQAWLIAQLQAQIQQAGGGVAQVAIQVELAWTQSFEMNLSERLSADDLWFQVQLEAQSRVQEHEPAMAMDFEPVPASALAPMSTPAPESELALGAGERRYRVYLLPSHHLQVFEQAVRQVGARLHMVGVWVDSPTGTATVLPLNFLPHRERQAQQQRRIWLWQAAGRVVMGALLSASLAVSLRWVAPVFGVAAQPVQALQQQLSQVRAQHQEVQAAWAAQQRQRSQWRQRVAWQTHSLQWQQLLQQAPARLWWSELRQQGRDWVLSGEALNAEAVQQLQAQLSALGRWHQPPKVERLQWVADGGADHLPVWQFQLVAVLPAVDAPVQPASEAP